MKYKFLVFLLVVVSFSTFADVTLPNHFSDKMVIQRNSKNLFWGWAEPNEKVSISTSWCGVVKHTFADSEGNWSILIGTPEHQKNQKITVKGNNTIVINDVSIGEVWLGVGQSNMGWGIFNTFNGEETMLEALEADITFYNAPKDTARVPQIIQEGSWVNAQDDPELVGDVSAAAFHFALKLYKELDMPIGVILESYGGTPVEAWTPLDIQLDDPVVNAYVNDEQQGSAKALYYKYIAKQAAKYLEDPVANSKLEHFYTDPIPFEVNYQYPGVLYNAMINPIVGYGIKGMIYYQGERNSKEIDQAERFGFQLPKLVNHYRSIWNERSKGNVADDFSCYFVQLPSYKGAQELPVENDTWPRMREVMRNIPLEYAGFDYAVTMDTGDSILLHPQNKKPVGIRLAYHALKNEYGKNIVNSGPIFQSHSINGAEVELTFDTQGANIVAVRPNDPIDLFAIAGEDEVWHWADNVVISGNKITVSSSEVTVPLAVRYAWSQNPSERNLIYNNYGLPATSFRTDSFEFPKMPNGKDILYRKDKPQKPAGYDPQDWYRPEMPQ